jgi:hypothetical protein
MTLKNPHPEGAADKKIHRNNERTCRRMILSLWPDCIDYSFMSIGVRGVPMDVGGHSLKTHVR